MSVVDVRGPVGPVDDSTGADRSRVAAVVGVRMLVGFDAVLTALTIGAWITLRAVQTGGRWRFLGCTRAHPCLTPGGYTVPGPVPLAGTFHLAGVVAGAVLFGLLAWQAERSVRAGAGPRRAAGWVVGALVVVLGSLGLLAVAYHGLLFNRFDGAYATAYWYVLVSVGVHLVVALVVLAGLANRIRLGRTAGDTTPYRVVRILVVWTAAAVVLLCALASVGG